MSLNEGPEKPLHEAVKMKPGLCWETQDVGDSRTIRYLLRKAADLIWNQSKKKKCTVVNKAEKT